MALPEPAGQADAVQQWMAFVEAMEEMYGSLAIVQGEPSARHTPDELRAVAEIAASLGIRPDDAPALIAQSTWPRLSAESAPLATAAGADQRPSSGVAARPRGVCPGGPR